MRAPRGLLVLACLALAVPAAADDRATAEKHFRTGERLFGAGDFAHAARSFEDAYATLPLPAIAFSAAQAYRMAWAKAKESDKDPALLRRAAALYRIYVEQEPKGDRVVEATAALGDLEPLLARLGGAGGATVAVPRTTGVTITSSVAGVSVAIDGGPAAPLPLVRELPPGDHALHATADGYGARDLSFHIVDGVVIPVEVELDALPARLAIRAEAGSQLAVDGRDVGAVRRDAVEVPAGRHLVLVTRRGRRAWAQEVDVARGQELTLAARQPSTLQRRVARWTLYGAGGLAVGAGVAATLAVLADGDAAALADQRDDRGLTPALAARYDELRAARDDRRAWAFGLGGAAAAVGLTGALLYWFDRDDTALPLTVAPTVTGGGGGVTLGGAF